MSEGEEMRRKIRVTKLRTLNIYWIFDLTDLDRMINSPTITIEKFEDLLNYRMANRNDEWEFAEDFPEEEKIKLKYLIPTELCDFDNEVVRAKTEEIISEAKTDIEKSERILDYCQNQILFAYGNWDEKASEVKEKGEGMCSGKNNLSVAMHRFCGIPARHKKAILEGESEMWKFVSSQDSYLAKIVSLLPPRRDHIFHEIYLNGKWEEKDVTRDKDLEEGMKIYGIPLERDLTEVEVIEDFDSWAKNRQNQKTINRNREEILERINHFVEKIREIGKTKAR